MEEARPAARNAATNSALVLMCLCCLCYRVRREYLKGQVPCQHFLTPFFERFPEPPTPAAFARERRMPAGETDYPPPCMKLRSSVLGHGVGSPGSELQDCGEGPETLGVSAVLSPNSVASCEDFGGRASTAEARQTRRKNPEQGPPRLSRLCGFPGLGLRLCRVAPPRFLTWPPPQRRDRRGRSWNGARRDSPCSGYP